MPKTRSKSKSSTASKKQKLDGIQDTPQQLITSQDDLERSMPIQQEADQDGTQSPVHQVQQQDGLIPPVQKQQQEGLQPPANLFAQQIAEAIMSHMQTMQPQQREYDAQQILEVQQEPRTSIDTPSAIRPSIIHRPGMLLSLGVSTEIRKKIHQNEYVDFAQLLNKSQQSSDFKLQVNNQGSNNQIVLTPVNTTHRINSIEQWTKAFLIFCTIHLEKFPHEAVALNTYQSNITQLATEGANWFFYDQQFRMRRELDIIPWDTFDHELWVRAQTAFRRQQYNTTKQFRTQASQLPRGFCFKFLQGYHCPITGCSFKHYCPNCGEKHQLSKCTSNANRKQYSKHSQGTTRTANPKYTNHTSTSSATNTNKSQ